MVNRTILEKVYKMYLIASYLRCIGKQTNTWRHHRPFFASLLHRTNRLYARGHIFDRYDFLIKSYFPMSGKHFKQEKNK